MSKMTKEVKTIALVFALIGALWAIDTTQNNIITGYQTAEETDYSIPGFVLEKGWNLIGITGDMTGKTAKEIQGQCDIKYAFAYDNAANLHLMTTPTKEAPLIAKLVGNAMWLYTTNKCRYDPEATLQNVETGRRFLFSGINTTLVTQDMTSMKIKELPGCENKIEKAWVYLPSGVSEKQEEEEGYIGWQRLLPNDMLGDAYIGKGMIIKGNCEMFPNYQKKIANNELLFLKEGQTDTYILNGKTYETTADFIGTAVIFTINGQATPALIPKNNAGYRTGSDEYRIADGTKILISHIYQATYAGDTPRVWFWLFEKLKPVEEEVIGSAFNANWQCYNGDEQKHTSETCTPTAKLKEVAENYCQGRCSGISDNRKCGVNSFKISQQCGESAIKKADLAISIIKTPLFGLVSGRTYGSPTSGSIYEKDININKDNLIVVEVINTGTVSTPQSTINKGDGGGFYTILYLKKDGKIINTIASERMNPLTSLKEAETRNYARGTYDYHDYLNFTWQVPEELEPGDYELAAVTDTQEAISEVKERINEIDETNNEDVRKITIRPEGQRVFVTTETYPTGNLGGLAGADAKCQRLADIYKTGGEWKAWLSTSTVNAKDRIPDKKYVNMKGQTIAENKADLLDGTLKATINYTERGDVPYYLKGLAGYTDTYKWTQHVWTGSYPSGKVYTEGDKIEKGVFTPGTPATCKDWTSPDKQYAGSGGNLGMDETTGKISGETTSIWTTGYVANCDGTQGTSDTVYGYRLYCFETG